MGPAVRICFAVTATPIKAGSVRSGWLVYVVSGLVKRGAKALPSSSAPVLQQLNAWWHGFAQHTVSRGIQCEPVASVCTPAQFGQVAAASFRLLVTTVCSAECVVYPCGWPSRPPLYSPFKRFGGVLPVVPC
jgi:hypothetical protein